MKKLLIAILLTLAAVPAVADDYVVRDEYGRPVETFREDPIGTYIRRGPMGEFQGTVRPGSDGVAIIRDAHGKFIGSATPGPDGTYYTTRDQFGRRTGTVAPDGIVRDSRGRYEGAVRKR